MFDDATIERMLKDNPNYTGARAQMSGRTEEALEKAWGSLVELAIQQEPLRALSLLMNPQLKALFGVGFMYGILDGMILLNEVASHEKDCECQFCKFRRNV